RGIMERRTPLLFIGNNRYEIDGIELGARRHLDRGYLSIHVINRTDRWGLIVLAARALLGRLRQSRDFETLQATHLLVQTRRSSATVATDGEIARMAMPLDYRIDPRALTLVVPAGDQKAQP